MSHFDDRPAADRDSLVEHFDCMTSVFCVDDYVSDCIYLALFKWIGLLLSLERLHHHFVPAAQPCVPRTDFLFVPEVQSRLDCYHLHHLYGSNAQRPSVPGGSGLYLVAHLIIVLSDPFAVALFSSIGICVRSATFQVYVCVFES